MTIMIHGSFLGFTIMIEKTIWKPLELHLPMNTVN